MPVIDCSVAHTHEIFTTVPYTENDVYPGEEALGSFAQVECLSAFEPFVGVSPFDSSLSYTLDRAQPAAAGAPSPQLVGGFVV